MIINYKICKRIFVIWLIIIMTPFNAICNTKNRPVYKVGPDDIITLTIIAGGVAQAKADLVVSGQGEVSVPFLGNVKVSGLTLKDIEKTLYIPLEKNYFVDPQVHIQMKEYHSLSFTISGAVKKPGKFELDFHPSIMDLIAQAGGVVSERGSIAYVIRYSREGGDNDPMIINLSKLLDEGDMSGNIMLKTGDKIYIPLAAKLDQAMTKVYLEGEIKKPGMLNYQPGLTALNACIMAGGFGKYAAPNRARIIRQDGNTHKIIKINLNKIKDGKTPDLPLKPGDRIHIPETWL